MRVCDGMLKLDNPIGSGETLQDVADHNDKTGNKDVHDNHGSLVIVVVVAMVSSVVVVRVLLCKC